MKVEILHAGDFTSEVYSTKYTHGLAFGIKKFVENEKNFVQDIRIIGENSTLTAMIFYEEKQGKKENSHA